MGDCRPKRQYRRGRSRLPLHPFEKPFVRGRQQPRPVGEPGVERPDARGGPLASSGLRTRVQADGPESDRVHLLIMTPETPACLPASIVPILWDVDPADVDVEADRAFLIGRVLSAGNLESIRWARRRYGDDAIRDWIVRHEGRQLSGPQIRFWETVIGLPADEVARWLAAPERTIWESRE